MRHFLLIILLLSSLSFSIAQIPRTEADDYIEKFVPSFEIKDKTLYEAIQKLSSEQKIRISFEEKRPSIGRTKKTQPKLLTASFKSMPVRDILDKLIVKSPEYFWEFSRNGLLNIIPRSKSMGTYDSSTLSWQMPGFKVLTSNIRFITDPGFIYGQYFQIYGLSIDWAQSTVNTEILSRPLTINLPPSTGRDGLNSIVKSAGPAYIWHLYWKKNSPIIEFRKAF